MLPYVTGGIYVPYVVVAFLYPRTTLWVLKTVVPSYSELKILAHLANHAGKALAMQAIHSVLRIQRYVRRRMMMAGWVIV